MVPNNKLLTGSLEGNHLDGLGHVPRMLSGALDGWRSSHQLSQVTIAVGIGLTPAELSCAGRTIIPFYF